MDWVARLRQSYGGGGWRNLGVILDLDHPPIIGPDYVRRSDLPESVSRINLSLFQPVPSLTFVVGMFILNDAAARRVNDQLQIDYDSFATPSTQQWTRIHDPLSQKTKWVRKARGDLRSQCFDWFRKVLPGLFATAEGDEYQSIEFITVKNRIPYSRKRKTDPRNYMRVLGISWDPLAMESDSLPSLHLGIPGTYNDRNTHLIVAAKSSQFYALNNLEAYGGRSTWGVLNYLQHPMAEILHAFSLYFTALQYVKRIQTIRDRLASVIIEGQNSSRFSDQIAADLASVTRDVFPVASDIQEYVSNKERFLHSLPEFRSMLEKPEDPHLFENFRQNLMQISEGARRNIEELQQSSSQVFSLLNTRSQRGLQKRIVLLAVLTFAATVISVLAQVLLRSTTTPS